MSSLIKNIELSIITFSSRIVSGTIIYIVLARAMSLNDFGVLTFGTTLAGLLAVIAEFGFSLMAQRDIPQERFEFNSYVFNTFIQKIGFSILTAVFGLVYLFIYYSDLNLTIGIIFVINAIISSHLMYFFSVFRAKNMFKVESRLSVFYAIVLVIIIAIYFIFKLNVIFIAWSILVARILQFIISLYIFIKKFSFNFVVNKKIQVYLFKNSFSFGAHYIIGVFYFTIDNQLIAYYSGNEALAIYQAIFKIVFILLSVNTLFEGVFLPYLSKKYKQSSNEFKKLASIINKVIIVLGLSFFVFFNLFAYDLVTILYSEKYLASLSIAIPLGLVLLTRIMTTVYSVLLTISDHQNMRVLTVFISLIVNVTLNFIFIPKHGYIGAAYVSMITHFIMLGLYISFSTMYVKSFLIRLDLCIFLIITVLLVLVKHYLNIEFNMISSIGILLIWILSLYILYNKQQIKELKDIFTIV